MTGLAHGVAVTVWDAGGLLRALTPECRALLTVAQPAIVQLHSAPVGMVRDVAKAAEIVRELVPGVEIWAGIGCDGWLDGKRPPRATADKLLGGASAAIKAGARVIVWNAEGAYKARAADGAVVARTVTSELATMHPEVQQAHTAYDHPGYHSSYPWEAWIGPKSPVTLALPQVYAAPGGEGVLAHRGALPAREKRALASWAAAVRAGWIKPDIEPDVPHDLDWRPYVQLHSVRCADTVALADRYDLVALWAAPTRMDDDGRRALLAICELRRRGMTVRAFQQSAGLDVDGACGPETLASLGIG